RREAVSCRVIVCRTHHARNVFDVIYAEFDTRDVAPLGGAWLHEDRPVHHTLAVIGLLTIGKCRCIPLACGIGVRGSEECWNILDVEDSVLGARHVAPRGFSVSQQNRPIHQAIAVIRLVKGRKSGKETVNVGVPLNLAKPAVVAHKTTPWSSSGPIRW